jgi:hypothetical protein
VPPRQHKQIKETGCVAQIARLTGMLTLSAALD